MCFLIEESLMVNKNPKNGGPKTVFNTRYCNKKTDNAFGNNMGILSLFICVHVPPVLIFV